MMMMMKLLRMMMMIMMAKKLLMMMTMLMVVLKVDAAETLSSGVVIQVIGLLNINDAGNARFMQTFVLAPQSHKVPILSSFGWTWDLSEV